MALIEFQLPSDASRKITMREATVADAIDFSAVNPAREQEATTAFLNRLQDKASFYDSREWTVEDRVYALFFYNLSVTRDRSMPVTYICPVCGKRHTREVPFAAVVDTYRQMDGQPFREFPLEGRNVVVHPMRGADAESYERYTLDLGAAQEAWTAEPADSPKKRELENAVLQKRVRNQFFQLLAYIDMPGLTPEGRTETEMQRRPRVEEFLKGLPVASFQHVVDLTVEKLSEMKHGLDQVYEDGEFKLAVPGATCTDQEGAEPFPLHFSFRIGSLIPSL